MMTRSQLSWLLAGCLLFTGVGCGGENFSTEAAQDETESQGVVGENSRTDASVKPLPLTLYKSPQELLKDLPRDAFPANDPASGLERAACRKWLTETLMPRVPLVEFEAVIKKVGISGDGPFTVSLTLDAIPVIYKPGGSPYHSLCFGKPLMRLNTGCQVAFEGYKAAGTPVRGGVSLDGCTLEQAKQLRELSGKKATFRGAVQQATLLSSRYDKQQGPQLFFEPMPDECAILLVVPYFSVNGMIGTENRWIQFPGYLTWETPYYYAELDGQLQLKAEWFKDEPNRPFRLTATIPTPTGKPATVSLGDLPSRPRIYPESSQRIWVFYYDNKTESTQLLKYSFVGGKVDRVNVSNSPNLLKTAPKSVQDEYKRLYG